MTEAFAARDSSKQGLAIAAYGRRGALETPEGTTLPYAIRGRRLQVHCGDHVSYDPPRTAGDPALVIGIAARTNELRRQPGHGHKPEIIAVNLTHVVVVVAVRPVPDLFVTDRYVCAAELMGAQTAIAWNKSDLGPPPPEIAHYRELGITLLPVSALDGSGLGDLTRWIGHGTAIVVGQSGVGKSSLLNALTADAPAATGALSFASEEGRHTTTASSMRRLASGGRLIDTPGVRDFVPATPDARRIAAGFVEIARAGEHCRFIDCSHLREPDCAVQQAVEAGGIDARRYESYRRLMNLAHQAAQRARP